MFPLYLVLKAFFALIELLIDALSNTFTKKETKKEELELGSTIDENQIKKEQIEKKLAELRERKRSIEERIQYQERELSTIDNVQMETIPVTTENGKGMSLRRRNGKF